MNQEKLEKVVKESIAKGPMTGLSIALGRAGTVLHQQGFGAASLKPKRPVEPSTIFDVGAMTQSLATSTVLIALTSEHELNLNTPVSKWWPDFGEDEKGKVTLRHLLKHTSGLPADRPYYLELADKHADWMGTGRGKDYILSSLAAEALEYPPTYMLVPGNLGFMALGHTAELIGDAPVSDLFARTVAKPLGLEDTSFGVSEAKVARCADSFICPSRKRRLCGEVYEPNAWAMGGVSGHAGLFTTAAEATKIGMALAHSQKGGGGFLPTTAVGEFIGPKAKYKLGWETPTHGKPECGAHFSNNTIGHVSRSGFSLWIDLDSEIAVAVFATFLHIDQPNEAVIAQLSSTLPLIHDALMEEES